MDYSMISNPESDDAMLKAGTIADVAVNWPMCIQHIGYQCHNTLMNDDNYVVSFMTDA